MADFSGYTDAELEAIASTTPAVTATPEPVMTPAVGLQQALMTPVAESPGVSQLQSLLTRPTVRPPTEIELGVAQLRAEEPYRQLAADIYGRKMLMAEGASLGVLPKTYAAAEAAKDILYGRNPLDVYAEQVRQQDIAKEYVRQKEREAGSDILGISQPEIAGGLVSPLGALFKPREVARGASLLSSLATRGGNVATAAGVGAGAAGLQTLLSTPGTLDERLAAAEQSAKFGGVISGALGAAGQLASAAAPSLQSFGKSARRSAFGATLSDYTKSARKENLVKTAEGAETLTENALDRVIEKGYAGNTLDPKKQLDTLNANIQSFENQIDNKIAEVEKAGVKVDAPTFSELENKIKSGKNFTVEMEDALLKRLEDIKFKLEQNSGGKLSYFQDQKKAFGQFYDPKSTSAEGVFVREVYQALKSHIEKYVPEVKDLNKEVQSMILARPIPARSIAGQGADANKVFDQIRKAGYTTGGMTSFAFTREPFTGMAITGLLKALASPRTRDIVGQALQTAPGLADALGRSAPIAGAVAARPIVPEEVAVTPTPTVTATLTPTVNTEDFSVYSDAELEALAGSALPSSTTKQVGEAKGGGFAGGPLAPEIVSAIENNPHGLRPSLIKAVIKQESEGKVDAKSKAGAYGLMQLMPKTAKGLGVDATDPLENVQGGMRLINTLHKRYNNMELALAAYNWGEGNMARALNTLKTKGVPATWSNVKKYGNSFPRKLPQETRKYVDAVLNKEKQFS